MRIKNILIGEDVRQEVGNKLSLMGIFGSVLNIAVQSQMSKDNPVPVSLAFLVTIENTNIGNNPKDFTFMVSLSFGEQKINLTASVQGTGLDRIFHLPIPRLQLGVKESATLSVHVQIMKNKTLVSEDTVTMDIKLQQANVS